MPDDLEKRIGDVGGAIAALERLPASDAVDGAIAVLRATRGDLEARRPSRARRQFVTVLFADLVGFTALAERMDAEDVGALLNGLWDRLDAIVQAHGGAVDKHMGDGLMALWGADGAREGDAEAAVRAALEMQASLARSEPGRAEVARGPVELEMRIGINTGPVLVGRLGSMGELTALGDAVNVASRLEQVATPRAVVISHDTYRHVRGVFDVEVRAPMAVKGKADPVQTYLVVREKARAFRIPTRGIEGTETRTIGRSGELRAIQDAWRAARGGPATSVLTIVGDAGVGKSRLMADFDDWLELQPERVYYLEARATPAMPGAPHALIRALLSFRFQIRDSDSVAEMAAKLESGIRGLLGEGSEAKASILGAWLGFEMPDSPHLRGADAQQLHDRGRLYLGELLAAAARGRAAILVLDDLHWADRPSLDALAQVLDAQPGLPLLVLAATRPQLLEERPDWGAFALQPARISLGPLDPEESRLLVAEVLQRAEAVPPTLEALVLERAEGNPYYIEELVRMLIEDGVVVTGPTSWRVDETRLAELRVPATLTEILRARIDGLGRDERRALQIASIVGRTFWEGALEHLAGEDAAAGSRETIVKLESRDLIAEQTPSAFEQTREHAFRHALLRDVTYESVLKSERRRYHESAARWLTETSDRAGRAEEYACLIATHYELAGNWTEAAPWYRRAGECAASRFANADAAAHLNHALSLWPEANVAERFDLLSVLEQVHEIRADREAQGRTIAALRELSEQLDPASRSLAACRQGTLASTMGDYDTAAAASDVAIAAARDAGSARLEVRARVAKATAEWRRAAFDRAREQLEEARRIATGTPDLEAEVSRTMGIVEDVQGNYPAAREHFAAALALFRTLGRRRGIGRTLNSLGVVTLHLGRHDEARALLEEALQVRRDLGDRSGMGSTLGNLAVVALAQGDLAGAARIHAENLELCRAIEDSEGQAASLQGIALVARALGDYPQALAREEEALALFRRIGDRAGESETLSLMGTTALLLDRAAEAEARAAQALAIAREIDTAPEQLAALLCQADALALQGSAPRALSLLADAHAIAARMPGGEWLARTKLVRARVRAAAGDPQGTREDANAVLDHLARHPSLGPEDPLRPYVVCWQLLASAGDPRAGEAADAARRVRDGVLRRLDSDDARARYLSGVHARQL